MREQTFSEHCSECEQPAQEHCLRCSTPLCAGHFSKKRRCTRCEKDYRYLVDKTENLPRQFIVGLMNAAVFFVVAMFSMILGDDWHPIGFAPALAIAVWLLAWRVRETWNPEAQWFVFGGRRMLRRRFLKERLSKPQRWGVGTKRGTPR
jgi:uncharacterized protein (DUF983 family)